MADTEDELRALFEEMLGYMRTGYDAKVGQILDRHPEFANRLNAYGFSPLECACGSGGDPNVLIDMLFSHGLQLDKHKEVMFKCVRNTWDEPLARIIHNGGDVNVRDEKKNTLLHAACSLSVTPATRLTSMLLEYPDIDINAANDEGQTPLHVACDSTVRYWSEVPARSLIKAGADISIRDNAGKTPLDIARERGRTSLVELMEKKLAEEKAVERDDDDDDNDEEEEARGTAATERGRTTTRKRQRRAEDGKSLDEVLKHFDCGDSLAAFARERVRKEDLYLLDESDLERLGVPMGPRKRLMAYAAGELDVPEESTSTSTTPAEGPSEWACQQCTFLNEAARTSCEMCGGSKRG